MIRPDLPAQCDSAAGSARLRLRSRSTLRSPPLASYLRLGPVRHAMMAFSSRSAVRCTGTCGEYPVQQIRGAAQRVPDMERPADQRRDPGQGPPLILTPPQAAAPSSAARSRRSCALPSQHTAPPGLLDASAASPARAIAASPNEPRADFDGRQPAQPVRLLSSSRSSPAST